MADGLDWRQVAHRIGDQTVILGDCRDVMARMEPGSVDVVVTSPPYNLSLAYHVYDDLKTEEDYIAWLAEVATRVKDVLKPDGSFFLNIAGSNSRPYVPFEILVRLGSRSDSTCKTTLPGSNRSGSAQARPATSSRFRAGGSCITITNTSSI